jgi:hypothetical protein
MAADANALSDNLMKEMYDADYMINAAALKAHARQVLRSMLNYTSAHMATILTMDMAHFIYIKA